MTAPPRQLPLPLPPAPDADASFLEDASNAAAIAWLARPDAWPARRLLLWGPEGAGKSHLLRLAAGRIGLVRRTAPELRGVPPAEPTALDDADLVAEEAALFHLINACAAERLPLLMAARRPPAEWGLRLPDLASRLAATCAVELGAPSDALCAGLLARALAARQIALSEALQAWLLQRLPREAAAIAEAVARLDRAALAAGRLDRAVLREVLEGLFPPPRDDDCLVESAAPGSNRDARLL